MNKIETMLDQGGMAPIIAKNLKQLMAQKKVTAKILSQQTGVSYSTITKLVCAIIPNPGIATLKPLADYFAVTTDALISQSLGLYGAQANTVSMARTSVPLIDWNLITKIKSVDDLDLSTWMQWETVDHKLASPNMFALPCRKSMESRFPQGTVFFVDTTEAPRDGDLVVVKFDAEEMASLRELLVDPPSWQLVPISPDTPSTIFDKNKHKILGVIMLTQLVGVRS